MARVLRMDFKHGGPPCFNFSHHVLIFGTCLNILKCHPYLYLTTTFEFVRNTRIPDFQNNYKLPLGFIIMYKRTLIAIAISGNQRVNAKYEVCQKCWKDGVNTNDVCV